MFTTTYPTEGDRIIITEDTLGTVTLAGFENVEVTLDCGRVVNTHHIYLEPHPISDGVWYWTRTTPGLNA